MKKFLSLFCLFACLTFVFALPAFADNSKTGTIENHNNKSIGNSVPDTGMRSDFKTDINDTTRALEVDNDDNDLTTNNYRANAVGDDNDFNWSWLGLLGLLGLAGLRNRDRERT